MPWTRGRALASPDARAPVITPSGKWLLSSGESVGDDGRDNGRSTTNSLSRGRAPFTTAPDARAPTGLHVQGYLAHGLSTEQFPVSAYVGSSKNLKDLKDHKTRDDGRDAVMTDARAPVITPNSLPTGRDLYETFPKGREPFPIAPDARDTFIATSPFPGGREAFLTPRKQPGYEAGYR